MKNMNIITQNVRTSIIGLVAVCAVVLLGLVGSSVHAASYAYVDNFGDVRSVMASDWITAIITAPNIHPHSVVLLRETAGEFTIVGDNVSAF